MKKLLILLILLLMVPASFGQVDVKEITFTTVSNPDLFTTALRRWFGELSIVTDTPTGRGPSAALWADCDWNGYTSGNGDGVTFLNEYVNRLGGGQQNLTGTSTTEIADWIQTEVTSGLTVRNEAVGGVLRVSSEASATADDGLTVMYRATPFAPTDTKTIWFEARVALTNIDAAAGAEDQFFIGLTDTITSALPSGVVDDTVDKIGWFHHDGSTVSTLSFITAKTTVEEITTGAATGLVTGTYFKIGFKCEWINSVQTITPYFNGVAGTVHNTAASVPTAGTGLGVCLAAVTEGTTTALLDVDWVRVAQKN
jgi:hypothetical protein